jgi:riboflavin synthase alpha subunit
MNIECDIIAKYLEKLNQPIKHESKIDLDFLAQNDFI